MSLTSLPAQAAPLTALSAAAKPTAPASQATQVRWGGWHGGWGWRGAGLGFGIGALAAGALIGAAVASPYYYGGPYYVGYPYGYDYAWGYPYTSYSVAYPAYSYGFYRPYRRHVFVGFRPWRHSFAMYRVHRFHHFR